jgi:hypothetical protein
MIMITFMTMMTTTSTRMNSNFDQLTKFIINFLFLFYSITNINCMKSMRMFDEMMNHGR